jgi:hypothetical protein
MKVSDLQAYLENLGHCLSASGAKQVAIDLAAVSVGLKPFRDLPLKGFADFLVRAEAYSRGEVPLAGKPARSAGTRAGRGKVAVDVDELARSIRDLWDRVADPAVRAEQIEGALRPLPGLNKNALLEVAEAIELLGMKSKKKDTSWRRSGSG